MIEEEPNSESELQSLATALFTLFSRFEYALKAAGFHKGEGPAEPDWDRFASVVRLQFEECDIAEFKISASAILAAPPRKQVIRDGRLDWEDAHPVGVSDAERIFIYVRRVRNNLFHGGKFNGHWFAPERSRMLLKNSILILETALSFNHDVNAAFKP